MYSVLCRLLNIDTILVITVGHRWEGAMWCEHSGIMRLFNIILTKLDNCMSEKMNRKDKKNATMVEFSKKLTYFKVYFHHLSL